MLYCKNIQAKSLHLLISLISPQIAEDSGSPSCDRAELLLQQGHQQQLCVPNASPAFQQNNAGVNSNGQNHIDRAANILMMSPNDQSNLRNRKRTSQDVQRFVHFSNLATKCFLEIYFLHKTMICKYFCV